MTKPGLINKAVDNAYLLALFAGAGVAIVAGRKAAWWAGTKAYNVTTAVAGWSLDTVKSLVHFTFKEGAISGPTSAGILAGTATALSYKYSPVLVRRNAPIPSQEHFSGNHLFWIGVSTFALTAFAIRYSNGKLSTHQMTRNGALTYATLATISSIAGVTLVDIGREQYSGRSLVKYEKDLGERVVGWFMRPSESEIAQAFWQDGDYYASKAEYLAERTPTPYSGGLPDEAYREIVNALKHYNGAESVAQLLNAILEQHSKHPTPLAQIFRLLPRDMQEAQYAQLHADIKPFTSRGKAEAAQTFWSQKPAMQSAAEYLLSKENFSGGYMAPENVDRVASSVELHDGGRQVAQILNSLYEESVDASLLGQIFERMSEQAQKTHLEHLDEGIRAHLEEEEEWVPEQHREHSPLVEDQGLYDKYANTAYFGWNETAEMGLAAGTLTGIVAFASYFALKTLHAFGDAFPIVKGTLPAVMVMAPTYVATKHFTKSYAEKNKRWNWAPFVAAFFAGALLTPKVSSYVLESRVSYKAAAGVSASATLASLTATSALNRRSRQQRDEW